ncbi:MAG: hypothetical protein ACREJB_04535 [Planctomycetaceae bacterium]
MTSETASQLAVERQALDKAWLAASELTEADKLRLIARLATQLEAESHSPPAKPSLWGVLSNFGPAPTEEDLSEARQAIIADVPRDDISA